MITYISSNKIRWQTFYPLILEKENYNVYIELTRNCINIQNEKGG